jgi:hypothetical protein
MPMETMDTHTARQQLDDLVLTVRHDVHELNNLLGVIRNFTALVEMRVDDAAIAADLAVVDQATAKAIETVAHLGQSARAAAGDSPE